MKKVTLEILEAARLERENGATIKAILATPRNDAGETLNYGQFWAYIRRVTMAGTDLDFEGEVTGEKIVDRRNQGFSWGEIAIQANLPESRIRKMFEDASGVRSAGLRTGQGGRFLTDDPVFYTGGERRVAGTAISTEKAIAATKEELLAELKKASVAAKAKADKAEAAKAKREAAKRAKAEAKLA